MQLTRTIRFGVKALTGSATAVTLSIVDHSEKHHLNGEEWCQLVDHLCTLGHRHFLFAGGDPLAHPDARAIFSHTRSRGAVLVVTGGERLGATDLPDVDTLAIIVIPDGGPLPPILHAVAATGTRTSAEALVTARPSTALHLVSTIEAAAALGVAVFLTPDDPSDWGDERPFHAQPDTGVLLGALSHLKQRRRQLNLMVADSFLDELGQWWTGETPCACHGGDGLLAIDPRGRPRACRRARAVDVPITSIDSADRLRDALIAARPSPCRCFYDDYWDHALARKSRVWAIHRAVRRTLRARLLKR